MSPQELFSLLAVNDLQFNGDVELTDVGVLWSLKFEAPVLLEEEEALVAEEELVEALEEDLQMIKSLFKFYKEDVNYFDVEEFQIEDDLLYVEFILED